MRDSRLYLDESRILRWTWRLRLAWSDWAALHLLGLFLKAAQDPQCRWQSGEIGEQREDEGRRGDNAELPHRRQVRQRQGEEAARIDERREQDRASGNQHRMPQGRSGRAVGPLL